MKYIFILSSIICNLLFGSGGAFIGSGGGGGGGGISSINGNTNSAQIITSGTAGTNVSVSSSAGTTTINIPIASATNTGKLSSADWTTFNNKGSASTLTNISSNVTLACGSINFVNTNVARNLTLPAPSTCTGSIVIKDVTGSAETNVISILRNSSESIEGVAATLVLQSNYGSWRISTDSTKTNWWLIK